MSNRIIAGNFSKEEMAANEKCLSHQGKHADHDRHDNEGRKHGRKIVIHLICNGNWISDSLWLKD